MNHLPPSHSSGWETNKNQTVVQVCRDSLDSMKKPHLTFSNSPSPPFEKKSNKTFFVQIKYTGLLILPCHAKKMSLENSKYVLLVLVCVRKYTRLTLKHADRFSLIEPMLCSIKLTLSGDPTPTCILLSCLLCFSLFHYIIKNNHYYRQP